MNGKTLTLFNTSILTSYGKYSYDPISLEEAKQLVRDSGAKGETVQSAIGHQSTADLLTMLLGVPVAVNRTEFKQTVNDVGLIFKLKQRTNEGKVLNRDELDEIGYDFGLLTRVS